MSKQIQQESTYSNIKHKIKYLGTKTDQRMKYLLH